MSRLATHVAALSLGVAAVLALASCGGGEDAKLLPGTTAQQISENVASVRDLAAEGECVSARDAAQEVGSQVEDLSGIDAKLKEALENGAAKLNEVVLTCTEEPEEEELEETLPEETTTPKKPEKPKPGKEKPVAPPGQEEEPGREEEVPKSEQAPPKGEAKGHQEAPPEAAEPPSGGIGPGSEAGGGG